MSWPNTIMVVCVQLCWLSCAYNFYVFFPFRLDYGGPSHDGSFSSSLMKSSTPTMACLSTLPMTPTRFRSAPPSCSSTTIWSGSDLLVGSLVWSSLKDSYWMYSSQGLSINHYSASEYMHTVTLTSEQCTFFWLQTQVKPLFRENIACVSLI